MGSGISSQESGIRKSAVSKTGRSRSHATQGRYVEQARLLRDLARDEAGGDRRAVVMQHRNEPRRIDAALVDEQRLHLRVAVLLDQEDTVVRQDELVHRFDEGEA